MSNKLKILTNGILKENPVLVLLLGTCPTLAVTTMAVNGLGMGAATLIVLTLSNIIISLLKKVIPEKVRIPCYIVVIATLVTIVGFFVEAYVHDIYEALGIFLPLIVVNCIVLGRAEMFASKNSVLDSALDGIGMGLGFTLALFLMGSIREILGSGQWFGIDLTVNLFDPIMIFKLAPGGFFVFGILVACVNKWGKNKPRKKTGCAGCPSTAVCAAANDGNSSCTKEGHEE